MNNTAIVILAAGNSARLGSSKQLLPYNQKTLLQHTIDEALASGAAPVVVVTGARENEISAAVDMAKVVVVHNPQWQLGKASGIVAGVQKVMSLNSGIAQIILMVCDQPFVSAALLIQLDQMQQESNKPLVASAYAGTFGTPVLIERALFDQLLDLKGEEGAKKLLMQHRESVAAVDFPKGEIDIDTWEDYNKITR